MDLDQIPQNVASDQGLHCLLPIQQYLTHQQVVKGICSNFRTSMIRHSNSLGKYGNYYLFLI